VGDHLGLTIDLKNGEFRTPVDKLLKIAKHASALLGRTVSTARKLPARQLAALLEKRSSSTSPSRQHAFSSRTPLRVKYATWMGRPSQHDTRAQARPRMVADSARHAQRTLSLQTDRDGVPTRRINWLRMGGPS
jgi:hypothetical protein